jgi:lipopolysaccharide export system protein LptA
MFKASAIATLCVASLLSVANAETLVIHADNSGREATVKIPVGAVRKLSANSAQSLEGYADPQSETMRLSGDVLISIAGAEQPIQIRADTMVLELTPDAAPQRIAGKAPAAIGRLSSKVMNVEDGTQIFVGNVIFDLQTSSGPMQIRADRVEEQSGSEPGA